MSESGIEWPESLKLPRVATKTAEAGGGHPQPQSYI